MCEESNTITPWYYGLPNPHSDGDVDTESNVDNGDSSSHRSDDNVEDGEEEEDDEDSKTEDNADEGSNENESDSDDEEDGIENDDKNCASSYSCEEEGEEKEDFDDSDYGDDSDDVNTDNDDDENSEDTALYNDHYQFTRLCHQLFSNNPLLTDVDTANLFTRDRVYRLGHALHGNKYVQHLTLNIYGLKSHLLRNNSNSGMENLLLSFIQNSKTLQHVSLNSQRPIDSLQLMPFSSFIYSIQISHFILSAIARNSNIQHVEMDEIELDNSIIDLLDSTASLRKLELRFCFLVDDGTGMQTRQHLIQKVTKSFEQNNTLECLIIRSMNDEDLLASILQGLRNHVTLKEISISAPDDGSGIFRTTTALGTLIQNCNTLQKVELFDFEFMEVVFQPIYESIINQTSSQSNLHTLSLMECDFLDFASSNLLIQITAHKTGISTLKLGNELKFCGTALSNVLTAILTHPYSSLTHLNLEELDDPQVCSIDFCNALRSNHILKSFSTPPMGSLLNGYSEFVRSIPDLQLIKLELQLIDLPRSSSMDLLINEFRKNTYLEEIVLIDIDRIFEEDNVVTLHNYCSRNKFIRRLLRHEYSSNVADQEQEQQNQLQEQRQQAIPISVWPTVLENITGIEYQYDATFQALMHILIDSVGSCPSRKRSRSANF